LAALLPFQPETDIERRILDVQAGKYSADALMLELANSELCIPSQAKTQDGWRGYVPVLLDQNGIVFVAVFTMASRQTRDFAPHLLRADCRSFVLRLPAGYGVIFNPGYDAQLLLPPDGVAMLKQDLSGR
jgi:hypothetical protein